ncbi:MAG TPA: family 16 glycoside hydrolase [Chthonomonadaceae bacterium]|nr:family 16 glycoside hydrolase [Chthonomonadaceae bacterium]
MKTRFPLLFTLLLFPIVALGQQPEHATLQVDAGTVRNRITPWMIGSCIEDVNHEIYGGLYAQLIFGESFEEPPPAQSPLAGWKAYGGDWRVQNGALWVAANAGAKLVRDTPTLRDGRVECDVQVANDREGNAALILRVSDPHTGADNWIGYEISLVAHDHALAVSRHRNDWHLLKTVPAPVQAGQWHHLRVDLAGSKLSLFLDGAAQPALEVDDGANAILQGGVGVRTWNVEAGFRNLVVTTAQAKIEDSLSQPDPNRQGVEISGMWDGWKTGNAEARYRWDTDRPFHAAHAQRIEHGSGTGIVGIVNRGLNRWGIAVRKGHTYAGRLYLRQQGYAGRVIVALQSADGTQTYAQQALAPGGTDWTRREFTLHTTTTDPNARFGIGIDQPGTVWVDQVTLMPTGSDLFHGLPFRADIGKALAAEGLTFLRYGGSMVNAPEYRWKQMIGDRDHRPQYLGTWYPHSTDGFGIEEFLQFCEAAHIEPAFAINIEETPQDAADLVEYLNGPVSSPWGARRAANGHPKPYHVHTIEIGNEEAIGGDQREYAHYLERFKLLEPTMHAKDPKLQLVIAAWWRPDEPLCKQIVQELSGKAALWDVHVGGDGLQDGETVDRDLTQMQRLFQEWSPKTTLKSCIFEENGGRHDMQRALGHAHILNVTRRHGDFCLMDCPANCLQPWKQNDNGWDQGQLFFTADHVWGMPPYFSQQMAAATQLPLCVESNVESPHGDLDVTAMRSEDGNTLVLSVVNLGDVRLRTVIELKGLAPGKLSVEIWMMWGGLQVVNPPDGPEQMGHLHATFSEIIQPFPMAFAPHSYTVLRFQRAKAMLAKE